MSKNKNSTKNKKYDIVSVGSATIDCFVSIPFDFKDIKQGSKILIDNISMHTGGGGTNVAVGFSRLGLSSGFIGELGKDNSAEMIQSELKKEGVDFLVNEHSRHQTAYSVVLESKGLDRSILVYKGASSYLHSQEIPKNIKTDWYYLASVTGTSFNTMVQVAKIAKKNNVNVFFNPSSYMTEKGQAFLQNILSATTILSLNKEEAQILLLDKTQNINKLLYKLNKLGPKISIITDGKNGAYVYDGKKFYAKKPKKTVPVDTTGAGDAFGCGFLAGYIIKKDAPLEKRILFAINLGLLESFNVISHVGAKTGLLSRRKAMKIING